jgi:hypothetical protein
MSAVAQLLDGDVRLLGFRGRDPQPGGGRQGFHADFAEPVPADRQCLANAFWLLDDTDEANGATRLVPGSHRLGRSPGKSLSQPEARHPGAHNRSGAPRRIAMAMFGRSEMARAYEARGYLRAAPT